MTLKTIINIYLKQHNLSLREFAKRANVSHTYVAKLANGTFTNPSMDGIEKIAKAMGMTPNALLDMVNGNDDIPKINGQPKIPLYSSISCGSGVFVDDELEEYITIPKRFVRKGMEYFACVAEGDSMIGKGIKSGDILIFERTQDLNNGDIGCFCIDNEKAFCKIFRNINGIVMLESANDLYDPIIVNIEKDCFRILGRYRFNFSEEQQ